MKLVTVAGPPSSGKTSVIIRLIRQLKAAGHSSGVVKFDCLFGADKEVYDRAGIISRIGISGNICPDHFFVSNINDCVGWGIRCGFDFLISESAGLCNRCSPHIENVLSVCVIDNLSGVDTPRKIGPMLKMADIVIITKGDIVSQAEREVFMYHVVQVNSRCVIIPVNGITGQGIQEVCEHVSLSASIDTLEGSALRFTMPASLCSYCLGQKKIGDDYQRGNLVKMDLDE